MTMADPFRRSIEVIDRELTDQVAKREAGINELLHALFVIERTGTVIDRLIEERLKAAQRAKDGMPSGAMG